MSGSSSAHAQRRGATAVLASLVAVALVAAAILGVVGYRAIRRYTAGKDVTRTFQVLPVTPTGLWVLTAADGSLGGVYVVVARPSLSGGSIVSIPTYASAAESTTTAPFSDVFRLEGADGLVAAMESALRLSFDYVEVSTPASAAAKLAAVAPLAVELPNDVTTDATSTDAVLTSGERDLSADEIAAVLSSPGRGTNASRAGNVGAVLDALAVRNSSVTPAPPTVPAAPATAANGTSAGAVPPNDLSALLQAVLAGPLDTKVLGTTITTAPAGTAADSSVPSDSAVDGSTVDTVAEETGAAGTDGSTPPSVIERFEIVDIVAAILVFGSIAPANMSTPSPGLNYSLAAPRGSEARVMDAIALILYLGGNVTRIELTAAAPREETVVHIYAERDRDRVATSNPLFGKVVFGTPDTPIEGIDVVVELGRGYLDHAPQRPEEIRPPTTSVTDVSIEEVSS